MIDAEGHYEGRYPQASTYISSAALPGRARLSDRARRLPLRRLSPRLSLFGLPRPRRRPVQRPAALLEDDRDQVDTAFTHTYVFNRAYGRPILPLGQVYLNPKPKAIRRFRALALAHGMEGVSWWSWQSAGKRQWKAVGAPVAAPAGYAPYNSYPFLRLGSKGDLVAWAQQLLAGGGYSTPITGYFQAPTQSAVFSFQAAKGLAQTGNIDVPTWDLLLRTRRCRCAGPAAARSPPRARTRCRRRARRTLPGEALRDPAA